jgi:hypothetical protein
VLFTFFLAFGDGDSRENPCDLLSEISGFLLDFREDVLS